MKKLQLSLLTAMALTSLSFAGGGVEKAIEPAVVIPAIADTDTSVSGFYVGIGASVSSTREGDVTFFDEEVGQDRTFDASVLAGYEINEYVAIEGRYQMSVSEEDTIDSNSKKSWGIFVKPQYYVTSDFKVYGLLGYGGFNLSLTNKTGGKSTVVDLESTGLQWGLGLSYEVYENISIYVDYLNLVRDIRMPTFINKNVDVSSDTITIGISYRF
ncbi:MAG: porin family protein [Sulfurovum sp.]|nr:porin family protein [Sulfurovum sp.]